ncbi:hypothetical protein PG985_013950 [Apiospora marii]|uniref:uncharacterized protein n=1 Tax=Apiospora marii TaxID=335849 RepID=UPI00312EEE9A
MASAKSQFACSIENDAIKILRTSPATHGDPSLKIQFMRTIRAPDVAETTTLPPGLGKYPLSKVSDHKRKLRSAGVKVDRGVFFPMHHEESMWISFRAKDPFLVKIYAGGVNAVSGEFRIEDANTKARRQQEHPKHYALVQDYIVVPRQLFLDGIAVSPEVFRQFEASPSGQEYGADVLMTKESFVSDLQLEITPHTPFLRAPPPSPGKTRQEVFTRRAGKHEVVIFLVNGTEFSIYCNSIRDTVMDLKLATKAMVGTKCHNITLIYEGIRLEDGHPEKTLFDYQHRSGDTIILTHDGGDRGRWFIEKERSVEVAAGGTVVQWTVRDWHNPAGWESDHTITIPVHILNPDAYHRVTGRPAPPSAVSNICAGLSCLNLDEAQSDSGSLQSIIESKQHRGRINDPGATAGSSSVKLKNVVADPDDLVSRDGPFRRCRTLVDIESELQASETEESKELTESKEA